MFHSRLRCFVLLGAVAVSGLLVVESGRSMIGLDMGALLQTIRANGGYVWTIDEKTGALGISYSPPLSPVPFSRTRYAKRDSAPPAVREKRPVLDADAIAVLQNIPRIELLILDRRSLSAGSIQKVVAMKDLRELSIGYCEIGENDLGDLRALTQLRRLNLAGSELGDELMRELRSNLPDCDIRF